MAQYFDCTATRTSSGFQAPIFTNCIEAQCYWAFSTDDTDPAKAWTT